MNNLKPLGVSRAVPTGVPRPPNNPSKAIEEMIDVVTRMSEAAKRYDEFDKEVVLANNTEVNHGCHSHKHSKVS